MPKIVCGFEGLGNVVKDHIEGHHVVEMSIPCDLCDKNFSTRKSLAVHKRRFHE